MILLMLFSTNFELIFSEKIEIIYFNTFYFESYKEYFDQKIVRGFDSESSQKNLKIAKKNRGFFLSRVCFSIA